MAEYSGLAPGVSLEQDIVKAAVFERHLHTGHKGLGFVGGYGLKKGAVATSVAHDSHNLIVVGTNDRDMVLAANAVRKNRGGLAVAAEGQVLGELALPIGGVMSRLSVEGGGGAAAGSEGFDKAAGNQQRYRCIHDLGICKPSGYSEAENQYLRCD